MKDMADNVEAERKRQIQALKDQMDAYDKVIDTARFIT